MGEEEGTGRDRLGEGRGNQTYTVSQGEGGETQIFNLQAQVNQRGDGSVDSGQFNDEWQLSDISDTSLPSLDGRNEEDSLSDTSDTTLTNSGGGNDTSADFSLMNDTVISTSNSRDTDENSGGLQNATFIIDQAGSEPTQPEGEAEFNEAIIRASTPYNDRNVSRTAELNQSVGQDAQAPVDEINNSRSSGSGDESSGGYPEGRSAEGGPGRHQNEEVEANFSGFPDEQVPLEHGSTNGGNESTEESSGGYLEGRSVGGGSEGTTSGNGERGEVDITG